jgi:hypothetical protein
MEPKSANVLMKVLGVIVGAYALFTGWGCATILILRNGATPPIMPDPQTMGSFVPVLMMLPSWMMVLWVSAAILYAVAAWRMVTGRRGGAEFYSTALAFDLTFLFFLKRAGAVHADPSAVDLDYVTATITVTLCAIIWLVQRAAQRPGFSAQPT